jgi:UTP-glucose-1-phosphate uridylyltransferase
MTKEVTKAVIAAAGLNSRMYPYTKVESKLMMQIVNKPVVEYLIEELASSGIKEVIIVSNHISKIKKFLTKDEKLNNLLKRLRKDNLIENFRHIERLCEIDVIEQFEPRGWMHEVLHSRKYIKEGPFVVTFSDVLYKSNIPATKQIIDAFYKTGKNIRAQARFLFRPDIFEILEREKYELGKDETDLDVFDRLRQNNDLVDLNIKGQFFNVGDPLSYIQTETVFALDDTTIGKDYNKFLRNLIK